MIPFQGKHAAPNLGRKGATTSGLPREGAVFGKGGHFVESVPSILDFVVCDASTWHDALVL